MILKARGKGIIYQGTKYLVGDFVCANGLTEYNGLVGPIVEIRTDSDKDTENITDDIYVDFKGDIVIMAADMIIPINHLF